MEDNVFAYLYELEKESSAAHKLNIIYDVFMSKGNVQILEKFNNSDQFNSLLEGKLSSFEQCLFMNIFQASIARQLLENVYLDETYREHIHFDLPLLLTKTYQSPFKILPTIRRLVINLYQFERFLGFYSSQNINPAKLNELLHICKGLRKEVEAILSVIKISLKNMNSTSTIKFVCFLIR